NIVWLGPSSTTWIQSAATKAPAKQPQIAFLWGDPQSDQAGGTLIKLPEGFDGKILSHSPLRAVVIEGLAKFQTNETTEGKLMTPGSFFSSHGEDTHRVSTDGELPCIIYVRSEGKFDVIP
ncbi:protein of unknown function, partial [Neorhodopirellula lusitana]